MGMTGEASHGMVRAGYSYFLTAGGGLEAFALEEANWRWQLLPSPSGRPRTEQGKVFITTATPIDASVSVGAGSCADGEREGQPLLCSAERIFVQVLRRAPLFAASGDDWPLPREPKKPFPLQQDRHRLQQQRQTDKRETASSAVDAMAVLGDAVRSIDVAIWLQCFALQQLLGNSSTTGSGGDRGANGKCTWRPPDVLSMPCAAESTNATSASGNSPHGIGDDVLRFRVCVKVGGQHARGCGVKNLSSAFAKALAEHIPGWVLADGKDPDVMQVYVQCNEQHVLIGLAAAGPPLSQRCGDPTPYPGLRSTVAWAMARVALGRPPRLCRQHHVVDMGGVSATVCLEGVKAAPIAPAAPAAPAKRSGAGQGKVVCDPFCGRGSLAIEILRSWGGVNSGRCDPLATKTAGEANGAMVAMLLLGDRALEATKQQEQQQCSLRAQLLANLHQSHVSSCSTVADRATAGIAQNVEEIRRGGHGAQVMMLNMDATAMPLQPASVDVFVTDPPFGQQHGNAGTSTFRADVAVFYVSL